jgi:hypothetical protein
LDQRFRYRFVMESIKLLLDDIKQYQSRSYSTWKLAPVLYVTAVVGRGKNQ